MIPVRTSPFAVPEQEHLDGEGRLKIGRRGKSRRVGDLQLTLFAAEPHPIVEKLRTLDLDHLAPIAALQLLNQWKATLALSDANDSEANTD